MPVESPSPSPEREPDLSEVGGPAPPALPFLQRQRVACLATADAQGRPHVVPVCFVYLEGRFYSAVDEKPKRITRLRRLRNIAQNPRVALLMHRYREDWRQLAWVLVEGEATVLEGGEEHARAVAALREKYRQYRAMALEPRPVIRVTPERILSWAAQ